jgi:hypothetical protein
MTDDLHRRFLLFGPRKPISASRLFVFRPHSKEPILTHMLGQASKLYSEGRKLDAAPIINKAACMVKARLEDAQDLYSEGNGMGALEVSRGVCIALERCEALAQDSDTILGVQTGLGEMLLRQASSVPSKWQSKVLLKEAERVLRKPYQHYTQNQARNFTNTQKCIGLLAGCLERQGKLQETETLLRSNITDLEREQGPMDNTCLLRQLSLSSTLAQLCAQDLAAGRNSCLSDEFSKCKEAELLIEWVVAGLKTMGDGDHPHPHLALAENTQVRLQAAIQGGGGGSRSGLGAVEYE